MKPPLKPQRQSCKRDFSRQCRFRHKTAPAAMCGLLSGLRVALAGYENHWRMRIQR